MKHNRQLSVHQLILQVNKYMKASTTFKRPIFRAIFSFLPLNSRHSAVQVRAELTARIAVLNRGRSNTEAWVKALKHDLAMERTKSEVAEETLEIQTAHAKVPYEINGFVSCVRVNVVLAMTLLPFQVYVLIQGQVAW